MLEIRDLSAGYEGVERLHGVNARLEEGCFTAIVGPNGSGKSTLIKCVAGLLAPTGGEIVYNGADLRRLAGRERARIIAYMPQSRPVPDLTVEGLAMHGRYPHMRWGRSPGAADRAAVEEALKRAEMTELRGRSLTRLSGGERQRAYLSMMLAQEAPLMLLDEPAAALDLSAQFRLMALLRRLSAEGRSVVVVMHDLAMALEHADRLLVLRAGEAAAFGSPEELYAQPALRETFGVRIQRLPDGKYVCYEG